MSAVLKFESQLSVKYCPTCSMAYAAPPRFFEEKERTGQTFYCPAGHSIWFKDNETDRLRKQLEKEKSNTEWYKGRTNNLEKQLSAQKGQTTKLKKRIANGICPCCKRSFSNLHRHMKSQHPDYADVKAGE